MNRSSAVSLSAWLRQREKCFREKEMLEVKRVNFFIRYFVQLTRKMGSIRTSCFTSNAVKSIIGRVKFEWQPWQLGTFSKSTHTL